MRAVAYGFSVGAVVGQREVLAVEVGPRGSETYTVRCACGQHDRLKGHQLTPRRGRCARCSGRHKRHAGETFGRSVLVRMLNKGRRAELRCLDCDSTRTVASTSLAPSSPARLQPFRCRRCRDAASRVPDAERLCRWCGRKPERNPWECTACERTAVRNGRHPCRAPVRKATPSAFVLVHACEACS